MQKNKPIGILLCFFGLVPLWFAFVIVKEHLPFFTYSTTEGTITRFEAKEANLTPASKGGANSYFISISYIYTVGGREFTATSISPSPSWYNGDSNWLKKKEEKFRENEIVTVWFEPDIPRLSYIDSNYGPTKFLIPMALVSFTLGILVFLGKLKIATKDEMA